MDKQPMTKQEIELLLIADLRTFPDCEKALRVVVVPVEDYTSTVTWTVSYFEHGKSDGEACERVLQRIVPRLQRVYDMVRKH